MHYVILSQGKYESYEQKWYVGTVKISSEELIEQGKLTEKAGRLWYEGLPKRLSHKLARLKVGHTLEESDFEKYNPETGENVYAYTDIEKFWFDEMGKYLSKNGYQPITDTQEVHYEN